MGKVNVRVLLVCSVIVAVLGSLILAGCTPPVSGLTGKVDISHPPKVDETAELSWTFKATEDWTYLKAWVQFTHSSLKTGLSHRWPISRVHDQIRVDGELEWEGSISEGEEKQFQATIKFPEEGNWRYIIYFYGTPATRDYPIEEEHPSFIHGAQELHITDDYARFGWPEDYSGGQSSQWEPDDNRPFTGFMDMEKPPPLNQPVLLTRGVGSIKDVHNVTVWLEFHHLQGISRNTEPVEDIVVSGTTVSEPDFVGKDAPLAAIFADMSRYPEKTPREWMMEELPLRFTTVVKFPQEGDWQVRVGAGGFDNEGREVANYCCALHFNVSEKGSTWGWREDHHKKSEGLGCISRRLAAVSS